MKCEVCNEKIEENFLGKLKGTSIKIDKKLKYICMDCQKKLSVEELKERLK